MKIVLKCLKIILVLLLLLLCLIFTVSLILKPIEKNRFKRYGSTVMVDGGEMNVVIEGKGDTTIVLMNGYQTIAPALDFKPLITNLSKDFRVVLAEPFGYGYSDTTEEERSVKKITEELHQCLQVLGITEYVLMPHSVGGIYALYYINQYPDEVTALIGMDTSVPSQGDYSQFPSRSSAESLIRISGMIRVALALFPQLTVPASEDMAYTDEIKAQIKAMTAWNYANKSVINEGKRLRKNFDAVRALSFPNELPVLFFISDNTIQDMGDWWLKEHEKQLVNVQNSKIIRLNGTHYLHWTCSEQIGTDLRDFLLHSR